MHPPTNPPPRIFDNAKEEDGLREPFLRSKSGKLISVSDSAFGSSTGSSIIIKTLGGKKRSPPYRYTIYYLLLVVENCFQQKKAVFGQQLSSSPINIKVHLFCPLSRFPCQLGQKSGRRRRGIICLITVYFFYNVGTTCESKKKDLSMMICHHGVWGETT